MNSKTITSMQQFLNSKQIYKFQNKPLTTIFILLALSMILAGVIVIYPLAVKIQVIDFVYLLTNLPKKLYLITFGITLIITLILKFTYVAKYIHKYRYVLCLILLVILTSLQISGSSIGMWMQFVNDGTLADDGALLGLSRDIRSDEWGVFTPMAFSQYYNDFQYFSSISRACPTDMFIIYGQAIADISVIFRPFQIGYLFLGNSYGLAFYWCSRLIVLFIITYDFIRLLLCNGNKILGLVGAMLVSFAPMIQWWFSINGYIEMIIAIECSALLFNKYLQTEKIIIKILCTAGISVCAGMYALTLYPPVMIPMTYVLIAVIILVLYKNIKDPNIEISLKAKDIMATIITLSIFGLIFARIIYISWDTIMSIVNTSYPGKRVYTGGDASIKWFLDSIFNFIAPMSKEVTVNNYCEDARFIDLFPVGYVLILFILFNHFKNNGMSLNLPTKIILPVNIFLTIVVLFPMPDFLMSITLLSKSSSRILFAIGYSNILITLACINQIAKEKIQIKYYVALPICVAIGVLIGCLEYDSIQFANKLSPSSTNIIICLSLVISLLISFILLIARNKIILHAFAFTISIIMFISGFLCNPIRQGTDVLENQRLSAFVQSTAKLHPENKWIATNDFFIQNYLIANGAPTINSVNTYPNLDRWIQLDDGSHYDIYNRYAHIKINFTNEYINAENRFSLFTLPDGFNVQINSEDLVKLDVSYILAPLTDIPKFSDNPNFTEVYKDSQYVIYEFM